MPTVPVAPTPPPVATARTNRLLARPGPLDAARGGLLITLAAFLVLYGWMLIATDFLPYGMDNNESFSSLWHAHNLYHFSFWDSAGLTDEAFSPNPEAHPFVHTHQGNAPRLFAFVIYALGARTIESQIAITTLLVGAGTVALVYLLFLRLVSPLFATVACLTLITDYVFFGQWAVVTYRIWHFTFVFGALFLVCQVGGERPGRWLALTVALFVLIFYYELVFAGFTAVFAGLFAGWQLARRPRLLAMTWAAQGAGALVGMGVLATQLTLHLGAAVALEDFRLTFVARNAAASDPALRQYMTDFFMQHYIVFWQNFVDVSAMRAPRQFVLLLTSHHLQWYSPLVVLLAAVLVVGWISGHALDVLGQFVKRVLRRVGLAASHPDDVPVSLVTLERATVAVLLLGGAAAFLALTVLRDGSFLALPPSNGWLFARTLSLGWVAVAAAVAVCGLAAWNGSLDWRRLATDVAGISLTRAVCTSAILVGVGLAIRSQSVLYEDEYRPLWHGLMQQPVPLPVGRAATLILVGLVGALALLGPRRVLGTARAKQLRGIVPYLVCGAAAYTTVFLISPGYVFSGYLSRYAPLAVMVANVTLAVAAYVVVAATLQSVARLREHHVRNLRRAPGHVVGPLVRTTLLTIGTLCLIAFWLHVQVVQLALIRPDAYAFVKLLGQPPLRGLSLFSNTYVAPMTAYTGSWGYTDTTLAASSFEPRSGGFDIQRSKGEYVWLRDRDTNPAYARPELFVCVRWPTMWTRLMLQTGQNDRIEGCDSLPLVRKAADGTFVSFNHQLVARDTSPLDIWAIVRMDWELPPYLVPLRQEGPDGLIDIDRLDTGDQAIFRAQYRYHHDEGVPEQGTTFLVEGVRPGGGLCTLVEQTGDSVLRLPEGVRGQVQVVVTPSTAAKAGPSVTSERFIIGRDALADPCAGRELRPRAGVQN